MTPVATATSVHSSAPGGRPGTIPGHGPVSRPNMASVGTIVWLSSELMFFAGLFSIYFTLRAARPDLWETNTQLLDFPFAFANTSILVISSVWCQLRAQVPEVWAEQTEMLNLTFAAINTTVLVLSSFTCQMGVFAAERYQPGRTGSLLQFTRWGMREWYVLTYIFGAIFVSGQIMEYAVMTSHGLTLSADAYTSAFYITTGFHGIHVTGGLIAFLLIIGRSFTSRRYTHRQATGAIVTS